jgi:hypothetical protein
MTREEALKEADAVLERLLASGDEQIFKAATDAGGKVNYVKLVHACIRARERIADKIMKGDM